MKYWYFLSPIILQKLIWVPTRIILSFFGRIEIKGLEHLSNLRTNVIFAANHSSEFDVFMIPGSLPFFSRFSPIFYTSREKDFYNNSGWRQVFYGGSFFKAWGAYPVSVGLQDYAKSMANLVRIVKDGGNMLIFPEGSTTKDGALRPAKRGVAYLAHATGRPVIPVRLEGTFQLSIASLFSWQDKLKITFGEPIYFISSYDRSYSLDDYKFYADLVMEKISGI